MSARASGYVAHFRTTLAGMLHKKGRNTIPVEQLSCGFQAACIWIW